MLVGNAGGTGAIIEIGHSKAFKNDIALPANPVDVLLEQRPWACWGKTNLWPQEAHELGIQSDVLVPCLEWKARQLYAGTLRYGKTEMQEDGSIKRIPMQKPEIEDFLYTAKIERYLQKASLDLYWFGMIFPMLLMTRSRNKIAGLVAMEAMYTRWEKQNYDNGAISNAYLSANWSWYKTSSWRSHYVKHQRQAPIYSVPVIDPYIDTIAQLRKRKEYRYILKLGNTTPGRIYYQAPNWYSSVRSKWFLVALEVPKFKYALMQNGISPKYYIKIPREYFKRKIPNFQHLSEEDKNERIREFLNEFDKKFTGSEKAGISFIMEAIEGFDNQNIVDVYPEIVPLEMNIGEGAFNMDSQEAVTHILSALGIPASLANIAPFKAGMGAGSGSDKREDYNIYVQNNVKPDQDKLLYPLRYIAAYNGWRKRIKGFDWWIEPPKSPQMLTLDNVTPAKRNQVAE